MFVETKEMERLAELVRVTDDVALENLSHYATGPAAMKLRNHIPNWPLACGALKPCVSSMPEEQSYEAAAANLERGRKCYVRAGLIAEWEDAVRQILAGPTARPPSWRRLSPSQPGPGISRRLLLERANGRWGVGREGGRK